MIILAALGTPMLWAKYHRALALSFALGCAIAILNFYWLKRTLVSLVDAVALGGQRRSAASVLLRFILRYVLIALAAYGIFKSSATGLIGLFAGLSLPVGAILMEAAYATYRALRRGF
jgi:hypothetical protein